MAEKSKTSVKGKSQAKKKPPVKKKAEVKKVVENVTATTEEKLMNKIEIAKSTGTIKTTQKTFDDDDMVQVASMQSGTTIVINEEKPFDVTEFNKFLAVEPVRYGTLVSRKKKGTKIFEEMLYILDEDAIRELGLEKVYEKMGKLEDVVELLNGDVNDILKFIDGASKATIGIVTQILFSKIKNKEKLDYFKTKMIAEKLGIELDFDI